MGSGAGKHKKYEDESRSITVAPVAFRKTKLPHQRKFPATLLTADVGGTNSRLHLFRAPVDDLHAVLVPEADMVRTRKFINAKYETFLDVIREFLCECDLPEPPYLACFAVAGVVVDNATSMVNLGWRFGGEQIADEFGMHKVHLINDFEAQGYGVLTVDKNKECDILQDAPVIEGAPLAVLGAGTGLGEAFLATGENGDYEVWPTEGGHREFAPRQNGNSKLQFELCQYLLIKFSAKSRISCERIISGRGIANIYQFLAWKYPDKVNKEVHRRFLGPIEEGSNLNDPAAVVQAARMGECELCVQAIDIFVSAYGSEAGVLAMRYMPFGGLFVTGGVTNKVRDFILGDKGHTKDTFMTAFLDKGRVTPMLMKVPVFLVRGEDLGERGVKYKCLRMYSEMEMIRQPSKGHMFSY